jgi:hypothetical protein
MRRPAFMLLAPTSRRQTRASSRAYIPALGGNRMRHNEVIIEANGSPNHAFVTTRTGCHRRQLMESRFFALTATSVSPPRL